jgi:ribosome biogenesis GTPase / thiamine phosphate phosphatase
LGESDLNLNLAALGWNEFFEEQWLLHRKEGLALGRVVLEHKGIYRIATEHGDLLAEITGKMRFTAGGRGDYPAVGDWVVISPRYDEGRATIHVVLPRKTKFSRKIAGNTIEEQIVAANVDTIFLVNALNNDFNLRRLERYLILAWESGANPVIVLSKADLCENVEDKLADIENIAFGVPILPISSLLGDGLEQFDPYIREGQTVALLGSSGVGKSSIVNRLTGQTMMLVQDVREGDDRGRHTTTHRELIMLPQGGLIIDTPGMRELGLWDSESGLTDTFGDVDTLAQNCRFTDCNHEDEPGCAVREALRTGELDQSRFDSYLKLQRELAYMKRKEDKRASLAEKEKWKKVTKSMRNSPKVRL